MSSIFVDFTKLIGSISKIEDAEATIPSNARENINGIFDNIISIGSKHDDCFASLNLDEINSSIDNTSSDVLVLIDNITTTINFCSAYSNSSNNSFTEGGIKSVGLADAMKWKLYNPQSKLSDLVSRNQITADYDYEYYNKLLQQSLDTVSTKREKATMSAIFLSTAFPHLPYFWGGGHAYNQEGCDPSWGTDKMVTAGGSETTDTMQPYSLDCSGFVDWALFNGGVRTGVENCGNCTWDYADYGSVHEITSTEVFNDIQPGDLAYMDGHIGMIIDKDSGNYVIAHCSGSGGGMNLTKISSETGLVVEDSNLPERVGTEYFTDVIALNIEEV